MLVLVCLVAKIDCCYTVHSLFKEGEACKGKVYAMKSFLLSLTPRNVSLTCFSILKKTKTQYMCQSYSEISCSNKKNLTLLCSGEFSRIFLSTRH